MSVTGLLSCLTTRFCVGTYLPLMYTHVGSHLGSTLPHVHIYVRTPPGLLRRALSVVTKQSGQYPLPANMKASS